MQTRQAENHGKRKKYGSLLESSDPGGAPRAERYRGSFPGKRQPCA
jgi:hypothetical protein